MSNIELQRREPFTANFGFSTAIFSWLSYGQFPVDASRPEAKDKRADLTSDQLDTLKTIFYYVLPALLIGFGAVLLIRRKRK